MAQFHKQVDGSGCGSVGRAVTFNTRGQLFESSQILNKFEATLKHFRQNISPV